MTNDLMAKAFLITLSIAGLQLGLIALMGFNLIETLIPTYAKWIYIGFGAIGGYTLYGMFRR